MKWYVIFTKVREEFIALKNLQNQGFEVFLPMCQVQKMRRQSIELVNVPLFSRYLFIRLSDVTSNWLPIRSTRGVAQLLRFGQVNQPVVVPDEIVECLRLRCTEDELFRALFHVGDMVEITQGPFKSRLGFFERLQTLQDGMARAMILVEILGNLHKLQLPLSQLKKASV